MTHIQRIGLGNLFASIKVYTANQPPIEPFNNLDSMQAFQRNDISYIVSHTGNHWRKVFNVFAKLVFTLNSHNYLTWQKLRDDYLLQSNSDECLLFSAPVVTARQYTNDIEESDIHIIMGKTYALSLGLITAEQFCSDGFAINKETRTIICPYFDYRQLSNTKIEKLAIMIKTLSQAL